VTRMGTGSCCSRAEVAVNADWAALERVLAGLLLRPRSAGFESARRPFIARFDELVPMAIARCARPEDVAAVIGFAPGDTAVRGRATACTARHHPCRG
jgi:hypothetical protein